MGMKSKLHQAFFVLLVHIVLYYCDFKSFNNKFIVFSTHYNCYRKVGLGEEGGDCTMYVSAVAFKGSPGFARGRRFRGI